MQVLVYVTMVTAYLAVGYWLQVRNVHPRRCAVAGAGLGKRALQP